MDRRLSQDILVYILEEVLDLYTLSQAVRLSRRVYGAYRAHARGITEGVMRNQLGSNFDVALRVVRQQMFSEQHRDIHPPQPDLALEPTEPVTEAEIQRLNNNAGSIRRFEEFFSLK